MRANSWLYHYYMVQARLQYNLAYGHTQPGAAAAGAAGAAAAAAAAHGASSLAAAIYGPQMMHMLPFGFDSAAAAQHGIGKKIPLLF